MGVELAVAGLVLGGAGLATQAYGQHQQKKANDASLAIEQRQEALRQQQMNLDATRKKREILRQSLAARSAALATTTAQGASGDGGSQLGGAFGSIGGRTGVNFNGVDQNQQAGNAMFGLNSELLASNRAAASAGSISAFGSSMSSLGGSVLTNIGTISRVGSYFGLGGSPRALGTAISYSK